MSVVKSMKEFNKKITSVMFVEMEVVPILTSMIQVIHSHWETRCHHLETIFTKEVSSHGATNPQSFNLAAQKTYESCWIMVRKVFCRTLWHHSDNDLWHSVYKMPSLRHLNLLQISVKCFIINVWFLELWPQNPSQFIVQSKLTFMPNLKNIP